MPIENVMNRTFGELFHPTIRFEIPFFQRGYAWDKKQWDQLFSDIDEQIIQEIDVETAFTEVEHFFGPVVVMEKSGNPSTKEYLVIDGQQRLTTVYLLLGLIRESLLIKKHLSSDVPDLVQKLNKYLYNDVNSADDYQKMKVFSSKGDRLPTYRLIFGTNANPKTPLLQKDLQAYVPGVSHVESFKKYCDKKLKSDYPDVPSLWKLAQVLLQCLTVVWIPLNEDKDDAQAIFESLNEKGMRLTASELLCNYVFRPILAAKDDVEDMHENQWLAAMRILEGDNHFEEYLRNLFSIGENKMVGKDRKVYVHFKSKHKNLTSSLAKQILIDIHDSASQYQSIAEPILHPYADEQINKLLIAIRSTRMESSTSFVLSVLRAKAAGTLSATQVRIILKETLVLLVRRKMTELSTTQYDVMFPQLLGKVISEPNQVLALHEQFRKHSVWVSDQEFKQALLFRPAYRTRDLPFARLLLTELDKAYQTHGQLPDYSTINSIEHILPQTLDDHWMQYLGKDAQDEHLAAAIHTLGNLCLLSTPANSSVGQNPFIAKKNAYAPLTALARRVKNIETDWNLAAIRTRGGELAEAAVGIWAWGN